MLSESKTAWYTLETCYQGVTKVKYVKLQNLRRDFENLKMKDNETVDNFMTQVVNVINQLRQYGEEIPDQRVIEKFLRCLPKKFEAVVVLIEEFKSPSQMHIDELTGSLIAHESRINRYDDTPLENDFKSQLHVTRGKSRGRGRSSNKGRGGQSVDHSESRNDSESEEKLHKSTPNVRGSISREGQQIN